MTPEQKQRKRERDRAYYLSNVDKRKEQARASYIANAEKHKERRRVWRLANPDKERERKRAWRRSGSPSALTLKVKNRLRIRLHKAICGGYKSGSAVRDLGCPVAVFMSYIASKFTEGMAWENYGEWHLDHIRPLASFDLTDREQFLRACHYSNYQPLWAADNLAKGARCA